MELNELKIAKGSRHLPKKVGRGLGSGMGKTSTRGQKGQGARQGRKVPIGFEGGQLPLYRRVPKHGFTNYGRVEYTIVKLADLEACFTDGASVNATALVFAGLIHDLKQPVKVLGNGELTKKLNVTLQAFTASAKEAIEKVGGTTAVESIKDARINFYKSLDSLNQETEIEGK